MKIYSVNQTLQTITEQRNYVDQQKETLSALKELAGKQLKQVFYSCIYPETQHVPGNLKQSDNQTIYPVQLLVFHNILY
jgi:hypothetical protein